MKFLVIAALLLVAVLVLCVYQRKLIKGDKNHVRRGYAIMACFFGGLGIFEIWLRFFSDKDFALNLPMAVVHLPVAVLTFFWFLAIGATGLLCKIIQIVWKEDFAIVKYGMAYSIIQSIHFWLTETNWLIPSYCYSLVTGIIFLAMSYYG